MTSTRSDATWGLRAALEACPPQARPEFQAAVAAALASAACTGDGATLQAVLDRWRPGPAPSTPS